MCRCLDRLAAGAAPATAIEGTVPSDPERSSAIWVREDPRYGLLFLTVVLEPGPKATVDDVRLALGALVRWKNAVNARAQKPFTEEAALSAVLDLHDQLAEKRGAGSRGIHVGLASEINERLVQLLRDQAHDVVIHEEARARLSRRGEDPNESSLEQAIREVVVERCEAGRQDEARFNSFAGGAVAESYLRALGFLPDAAHQICERTVEDMRLGREPFSPEYPADRRRVRELVRKAQRRIRYLDSDPPSVPCVK